MKITVIGSDYLILKTGSKSKSQIIFKDLPKNDPVRFKPLIEKGLGKILNISKALI
jgi:hypothetical protein